MTKLKLLLNYDLYLLLILSFQTMKGETKSRPSNHTKDLNRQSELNFNRVTIPDSPIPQVSSTIKPSISSRGKRPVKISKVIRQRKDADDQTQVFNDSPPTDDQNDSEGEQIYGGSEEYPEESLEGVGTSISSSSVSSPDQNNSTVATTDSPIQSTLFDPIKREELSREIERLVRNQLSLASTDWINLDSESHHSINLNRSDQEHESNPSLDRVKKLELLDIDHSLPEESDQERDCSKNKLHPNHNYMNVTKLHTNKILVDKETSLAHSMDPMTESPDESSRYGILPHPNSFHDSSATVTARGVTEKTLSSVRTEKSNILNPKPLSESRVPVKNLTRPFSDTILNKDLMVEMLQRKLNSPSRPSPVREDYKRPHPIQAAFETMSNLQSSASRELGNMGVHNMDVKEDLLSRNSIKDTPNHKFSNESRKILTTSQAPDQNSSITERQLLDSNKQIKEKTVYKLRPTQIRDSIDLNPSFMAHHVFGGPGLSVGHLNLNGSLAARPNANHFKNMLPKEHVLLPNQDPMMTKSVDFLRSIDPSYPGAFQDSFPLFHPVTSSQSWLTSTGGVGPLSRAMPFIASTDSSIQTLMNDGGTITATSSPLAISTLPIQPAKRLTTTLEPSPGKAANLKPLKQSGSRPHPRTRWPSQHHHHHSHVHSIKPALISMPIPIPSRLDSHDGLLVAAAAAAAAASVRNQERQRQLLTYSIYPQSDSTIFSILQPKLTPSLSYSPPLRGARPQSVPIPMLSRPLPPRKHPKVTIPIGGTLASTRINIPKSPRPPMEDFITTTYQQPSLLSHLIETAGRALKHVASGTANVLSLPADSNNILESMPNLLTSQRGSSRDYIEPLGNQLESVGLYQAPLPAGSNIDPYLTALSSLVGDSSLKLPKLPQVEEAALLDQLNSENSIENVTTHNGSDNMMFAPMDSQSLILQPVIEPLRKVNSKGSLTSLFKSADQVDQQSRVVTSLDSDSWSEQFEPVSFKKIPLNQHIAKQSNHASNLSLNVQDSKIEAPKSSAQITEQIGQQKIIPFKTKNSKDPFDEMQYALAHYVGDTQAIRFSERVKSGTNVGTKPQMNDGGLHQQQSQKLHQQAKSLPNQNLRPTNHDARYYEVLEGKNVVKYSLNPSDPFIVGDNDVNQATRRPDMVTGRGPKYHLIENKPSDLKVVYEPDTDTLYEPIYLFGSADQLNIMRPGKNLITSDSLPSGSSFRLTASSPEEYQSNESKNEEHIIRIMSHSSLYPGSDPLQNILKIAASGLKPGLTAASDLINYHKLKLLDHYIQYHLPGLDSSASESARLSGSSHHHHRAHMLLQYWPLALAMLPIMIIVAIVVQLVLAAPLILFAMTSLTVAKFVSFIFGPLFGREDLSNSGSSRPVIQRNRNRHQHGKLAAPSVPIPGSFLYSALRIQPTKNAKTSALITSTTRHPSTTISSNSKDRRKRRELNLSLEDYFEGLVSNNNSRVARHPNYYLE